MPRIYKYFKETAMGEDAFVVPRSITRFQQASFDYGATWISTAVCANNPDYAAQFQDHFSLKRDSATNEQYWFGWSNPYYPATSGHTYIVTMEVRNSGAAVSSANLYTQTASNTLTAVPFPGTTNQTEYTRVWGKLISSTSRAYVAFNATAGTKIQLDVRDFDIIDVTDVDPMYYDIIGRHNWVAFRNDLSAIDMKLSPGLTRLGNMLSIDTASEDEIAGGAYYKAVTTDKLKSYVEHSDSYKIYDTSGNLVLLKNLATTYTTEAMTTSSYSTNSQDAVWDTMRSVWGTVNTSVYGGRYYASGAVVRNKWIISNPSGHKYIVSYDVMNETDKSGSYATFVSSGLSNITGVVNRTYGLRIWEHCGFLVTASGNFSIDFRIYGLAVGDQFRGSFKNFKLYDVTNISSEYYPAIAMGKQPLLQGASPVQISGRMISYKKASVADVIGGTTNKDYIVDAHTLHSAVNLGRAVDVTTEALYKTLVPPTTYDLRGEFELTATSVASGTEKYYGFSYDPSQPFPKYAEDGNGNPFHYLFVADVKNNSTVALDHIAFNDITGTVYKAASINGVPIRVDSLPANQTEYTRIAALVTTPWNCLRAAQATGSAQTIKVGVRAWRQYEVTMLSDEAVEVLAKMSVEQLDDAYYKYLIKQDAICPFIPIIDMKSAEAVTLQAGLAYKLVATSGTHTLSVDTLPEDASGSEAYISITTSASSNVMVSPPLVIMDPLRANAINNCHVLFRNGEARLYVDDVSNGYIVVNASGTESGSLFYGLTRTMPAEQEAEYISFSNTLDGETIEVSGVVGSLSKPVSLLGNGKEETIITFLGGMVGTSQTFTISSATVKDMTLTSGTLLVDKCKFEGTINATNATINFDKVVEVNANIIGKVVPVDGTTIYGNGFINLNGNNFGTLSGDCSFIGVSYSNGIKSGGYGGVFQTYQNTSSPATVNVSGCTFSYCRASASGGAFSYRCTLGSITDVTVIGSTSGTWGGAFETSHNNSTDEYNEVSNVIVQNCVAQNGGGIAVYNNKTNLTNITITGCNGTVVGGGIALSSNAIANITNAVISGNSSPSGNGMNVAGSTASLTGCTFDTDQNIINTGNIYISGSNVFKAGISGGTTTILSGSTVDIRGNSAPDTITGTVVLHGGPYETPTKIMYGDGSGEYTWFEDLEVRGKTISDTGMIYGATVYSHAGDDHGITYYNGETEVYVVVVGETTYVVPGPLHHISNT